MEAVTAGAGSARLSLPGDDGNAVHLDKGLAPDAMTELRMATNLSSSTNPSKRSTNPQSQDSRVKARQRNRRKPNSADSDEDSAKRRCVSTACIACRKRKSKCDGNLPACAACSQVYNTECIYDPNSDHRRKGVYKNEVDNLRTRSTTLQTLVQAILNYPEDDVPDLIRDIRTCESLDAVADRIVAKEQGTFSADSLDDIEPVLDPQAMSNPRSFEQQLYSKLGDLRLDDGAVRYIGGTSNLLHLAQDEADSEADEFDQQDDPITSWTEVTDDAELVIHLLNMYFTWHYTFFTALSKTLFYRDFHLGKPPSHTRRKTYHCTPLLVNAILALGCHFTSHPGARENPDDSATAGDHFFREAKRLIMANDEHERPRFATVQALALMSVREAGCGREARGWVYSGMSFRMAGDMGLNLDSGQLTANKHINGDEAEEDVRRITFWGCFLFDKCWSNYLGRLPQLSLPTITARKPEVFPDEDAAQWAPYTDSGFTQSHAQPARTRAVALQITKLCEISDDLMRYFYNPSDLDKTKGKAAELKKLSDIHTRLEAWRRDLPREMEPKEGNLSSVLVMHMFFQLLFIHLFRPFLKYTQATSPLPSNVSPRKLCTQAAAMISKLLRLYKRSYGLRQICNIVVYIAHSACSIHLLNLPDKNAKRDITHGLKHLEEIAEGWLCARRTLGVLSILARKWRVELPEEAAAVLARTDVKFASYVTEVHTPPASRQTPDPILSSPSQFASPQVRQTPGHSPALVGNHQPIARMNYPDDTILQQQLQQQQQHQQQQQAQLQSLQRQQEQQLQNFTPVVSGPGSTLAPNPLSRNRNAPSPGSIFGGVEQLLREGQNWVYRDQAQYALGFDNWTPSIDGDLSMGWPGMGAGIPPNPRFPRNRQSSVVNTHAGMMAATPVSSDLTMSTPDMAMNTPDVTMGQLPFALSPNGQVARPMMMMNNVPQTQSQSQRSPLEGDENGWMNVMGTMAAYNEDEWYQ